jgi:hypothetical protein
LLGALAATTAACTPYSFEGRQQRRRPEEASRSPRPQPPEDPDVVLAATVLGDEQALLDRVEAVLRRHPRLERTLASARDGHRAHVELLAEAVPDRTQPSAGPETGAAPPDRSSRVPRDARSAVRQLALAEERLSLAAKRSAFAAESGSFARVLASMAAAAAQQAAVLRAATIPGGRR